MDAVLSDVPMDSTLGRKVSRVTPSKTRGAWKTEQILNLLMCPSSIQRATCSKIRNYIHRSKQEHTVQHTQNLSNRASCKESLYESVPSPRWHRHALPHQTKKKRSDQFGHTLTTSVTIGRLCMGRCLTSALAEVANVDHLSVWLPVGQVSQR